MAGLRRALGPWWHAGDGSQGGRVSSGLVMHHQCIFPTRLAHRIHAHNREIKYLDHSRWRLVVPSSTSVLPVMLFCGAFAFSSGLVRFQGVALVDNNVAVVRASSRGLHYLGSAFINDRRGGHIPPQSRQDICRSTDEVAVRQGTAGPFD